MWFRQAQVYRLAEAFRCSAVDLGEKTGRYAFHPCLPSLPLSTGWVPPQGELAGEEAPLFRILNGCTLFCLQIEEKILPATVIKQHVAEKVRQIEQAEARKLRYQEKNSLKDEMIITLLPRAFSRLTKIYGYLDNTGQNLVIGSSSKRYCDFFVSVFKKTTDKNLHPVVQETLGEQMTRWIKNGDVPGNFLTGKACVLHDPAQQGRVIRARQQELASESIQALLTDGCMLRELALNWQDQVEFTLRDDFVLQGMRFADEITAHADEMEPETAAQQMDADFFVMSGVLDQLLQALFTLSGIQFEPVQDQHVAKTHEIA